MDGAKVSARGIGATAGEALVEARRVTAYLRGAPWRTVGAMFHLETERLILRSWRPEDDVAGAHRIWGDPAVMRHIDDGAPHGSEAQTRRALAGAIRAEETHGISLWPMIRKADGDLVGCCGFHHVGPGPQLELAYHLARPFWGQGYATEAARACLTYARDILKATRVTAAVHPANPGSRRVLEKIGFHHVGPDPEAPFALWAWPIH